MLCSQHRYTLSSLMLQTHYWNVQCTTSDGSTSFRRAASVSILCQLRKSPQIKTSWMLTHCEPSSCKLQTFKTLHNQYLSYTTSTSPTPPVPLLHHQCLSYTTSTSPTPPVPLLHHQYLSYTTSTSPSQPVPLLHHQYLSYTTSTSPTYTTSTSPTPPVPLLRTPPPVLQTLYSRSEGKFFLTQFLCLAVQRNLSIKSSPLH